MKSGRAAGSGVTDPGKEIELISWVVAPWPGPQPPTDIVTPVIFQDPKASPSTTVPSTVDQLPKMLLEVPP